MKAAYLLHPAQNKCQFQRIGLSLFSAWVAKNHGGSHLLDRSNPGRRLLACIGFYGGICRGVSNDKVLGGVGV